MKTLKELNSKWYWRLSKVIYFFIAGIVLIASIFGYYDEFRTYDANEINKITENIEKWNGTIVDIKNKAESLNGNYSSGNIWKTASGGNISIGLIYYILTTKGMTSIEGVNVVCNYTSEEECYLKKGIDRTSYGLYKKTGEVIIVPKYEIDAFNKFMDTIEKLQSALDSYNQDKNSYSGYDLITSYNKNYGANISTYRNYHGFMEYIKIFLSFIATVAGIVIFTFIIKSITYYIILGLAFPKE